MTYYQLLDIDKESDVHDIKRAFRRLAHIHHPDKGGDVAKFKEINEAYQTLSDPEKRAQYDFVMNPVHRRTVYYTVDFDANSQTMTGWTFNSSR